MTLEDREYKLKQAEDKFHEEKAFWDRLIHIAVENKIKAFDDYQKETARLLGSDVFDKITAPIDGLIREVANAG